MADSEASAARKGPSASIATATGRRTETVAVSVAQTFSA
jgi:hypothetical protein